MLWVCPMLMHRAGSILTDMLGNIGALRHCGSQAARVRFLLRAAAVFWAAYTKSTFKAAHELRHPTDGLIFHIDPGSNYRSKSFGDYLKSLSVTQSFSRAHLPYDNSVMELFFSSLKREELYRTKYRSEKELRTAIDNYMLFYNKKRPHAQNGYKTPLRKETEYRERQK